MNFLLSQQSESPQSSWGRFHAAEIPNLEVGLSLGYWIQSRNYWTLCAA